VSNINVVEILLVEDNPQDVELTNRALEKHHLTNRVLAVNNGDAALEYIFGTGKFARQGTARPKVVLLDLKLPGMSGLEVLRAIKADEGTRSIPVVVVTSSHEDPDIKAAYELGANSYVVKPVQFEDFMEVVSRLGFYWLLTNQAPN
jgi:two-component system response regulator